MLVVQTHVHINPKGMPMQTARTIERVVIDPRSVTKEMADLILPINFGADGPSRGAVDGVFEFTASAPEDKSIVEMADEMRAWVRFHVTSHLHDGMFDDYLPKFYWIADEDITVQINMEDGWVTDFDCDGAETYRNQWLRVRVYVNHISDMELSAVIQHAPAERDIPSWVNGW